MNKISRNYKRKISKILKLAHKYELSLIDTIELREQIAIMKKYNRIAKKQGRVIDWESYKLCSFWVSFKETTIDGLDLQTRPACFDISAFEHLKMAYSGCPKHVDDIVTEHLEKMRKKDPIEE